MATRPTHNDKLPFIRADWQGNPLDEQGLYRNLGTFTLPGWRDIWKWQTGPKPFKAQKKADTWRPAQVALRDAASWPENGIAWLGHATFLIRLEGRTLITDPVLGNVSLMKRLAPLPVQVKDLKGIDTLLLSHNHRDHCDAPSMKALLELNPDMNCYTGLELGSLLKAAGANGQVTTAGWYQTYPQDDNLRIHYLPSKHWSRRFLRDTNTMLWGSFLIQSPNHTIYFGADSGYDTHFQEISTLFPSINVALLGVGAYEPRWFMADSHTAPEEAAQAAADLRANWWIPMHFGTFDLADEPISQPLEILRNLSAHSMHSTFNNQPSTFPRWVHPPLGQWLDLAEGRPFE